MVVYVDKSKLHLPLLLTVVFVELHLRQQQFRLVVEFHLKVTALGHVPYDFGWVAACLARVALVHR